MMQYELWFLNETDPRLMNERLCGTFDHRKDAEAALERKVEKYTNRVHDYAIRGVEASKQVSL
jgi:hypothetical protein